jgi:hypothetical protein
MALDFRIASPCNADWNRMAGDDRIRHCAECNLNVYNFAELTRAEIDDLVAAREGRLCARLYRRADGTMITKDCPVGFQMKVRRLSRIAGAALSAAMTVPASAQAPPRTQPRLVQIATESAQIEIEVADPSGAVIPNAAIHFINRATNLKLEATTDNRGRVTSNVSAGDYEIAVESRGFKTSVETVDVPANQITSLEIRLDISDIVQGGPMVADGEYVETLEVPLSKEGIPLLPVAPENNLQPAPSWLHKLRGKLHL